jgi:hypothetical protein
LRAARSTDSDTPSVYIGVDGMGTILASLAARHDGGPLVHLSLELDPAKSRIPLHGLFDPFVRAAYRRSICCVVQDRERFDVLSRKMGYVHPKPFFVPNAPTGSIAQTHGPNLFRELLRLPAEKFPALAVHAGIIHDIVYAKEVAEAFNEVDSGCALIFHERAERTPEDPYLAQLRQVNQKNLFLSLRPVPYEMIDRVFAAASIGLALYRPIDANLTLMGKASGKMAFHLKHGTPMIMNDLPSMVELNNRYQFGVTIHDPSSGSEMRAAVNYCLENHARLSANARRCFEEEFQFETKAAAFRDLVCADYPP